MDRFGRFVVLLISVKDMACQCHTLVTRIGSVNSAIYTAYMFVEPSHEAERIEVAQAQVVQHHLPHEQGLVVLEPVKGDDLAAFGPRGAIERFAQTMDRKAATCQLEQGAEMSFPEILDLSSGQAHSKVTRRKNVI